MVSRLHVGWAKLYIMSAHAISGRSPDIACTHIIEFYYAMCRPCPSRPGPARPCPALPGPARPCPARTDKARGAARPLPTLPPPAVMVGRPPGRSALVRPTARAHTGPSAAARRHAPLRRTHCHGGQAKVRLTYTWSNDGQTMVKRWSNDGQTMVKPWSNDGQTMVKRGSNEGQTTVK